MLFRTLLLIHSPRIKRFKFCGILIISIVILNLYPEPAGSTEKEAFTAADLLSMKSVSEVKLSPDGTWIAYTVNVPRQADDEPGSAYHELHVVSTQTGEIRPFITGKTRISGIEWRPDGSAIGFLSSRGENSNTQVWMIPFTGGEAIQITESSSGVRSFRWHPDGNKMAYIAETPKTEREEVLDKKGYNFIYFEENLKHRNLYMIGVDHTNDHPAPVQLTDGITIWSFTFSPDGKYIAAKASERNLVDYRYMFSKVYLLNLRDNSLKRLTNNPGKLGNFRISPDGTRIVYTAAKERKDHAVSQVYVMPIQNGEPKILTVPGFRGHVEWASWIDDETIVYYAGEGTNTTLSRIEISAESGKDREIVLSSADTEGVVFDPPSATKDFSQMAFAGHSSYHPDEVFYWKDGSFSRLTTVNPWLSERTLGAQEVVQYEARDGVEIEGILIKPVEFNTDMKYPLIVIVHGGPESHYSNGWMSSYSRPGQVLSNLGYLVFYPNYRSSTGYGLDFAMTGYNDAAGTEFDDVADAIDHFTEKGMADEKRIGLTGGSYGGYAAAWFSSYYTRKVKAVGMFVGISNLISKRGTTNIPYEELYVHSGKKLEKMWQQSLERSPIYYGHQSETAVLIMGGTDDDRVHPSQSLEFFRRLKMNEHPAVRMVQYPGEKHGNREQPGRIDLCYRLIDWFDWYVKDNKPLDGPMPALDISDKYGLDWGSIRP